MRITAPAFGKKFPQNSYWRTVMRKHLLSAVILVFGLLVLAGNAAAVLLELTISSGADSAFSSSTSGSVTYSSIASGAVGDWNIVFTAGTSDPTLPNTPTMATLDLTSQVVRSVAGSSSLVIDLKGTGFTLNTSVDKWVEHTAIAGTLMSGSVTWEKIVYDLAGNKIFDATFGPYGPIAGQMITTFGEHSDFAIDPVSGFTMESIITINSGAGDITSYNAQNITTSAVPEPGALLLLGFGLLSLSVLRKVW
jgi:hypothetical protein